jgi:hypothetical protein
MSARREAKQAPDSRRSNSTFVFAADVVRPVSAFDSMLDQAEKMDN